MFTDNLLQKITICVLGLIIGLFAILIFKPHFTTVKVPTGVMAPFEPYQNTEDLPAPISMGLNTIMPLAHFKIEGKLLSKKRYITGKETELSPVDFAMGWGRMSDHQVVQQLRVSQRGRWYFWKPKKHLPIPRREIELHSANMHIIPANDFIKRKVLKAKKGQIVKLKGYLVRVIGQDWSWKSSLSRNDTGGGACEIIYVEEFEVLN
ncbi:MAG: hypothetical protein JXQ65_16815 [Candidatus Marinimicrobia bacterium]|nr:hypothetical protein [Candidatus Neomarinimicrobiota bacterium]